MINRIYLIRNFGIIIFFSFYSFISTAQDFNYISEVARFNSLLEHVNFNSGNMNKENIQLLFKYADSLPVEIVDTSHLKNIVIGKVGFAFLEIDENKIISFFSIPNRKEVISFLDKKMEFWNGYQMIYFGFNLENGKFYKINGFRNTDITELIDDLMKAGVVKSTKDFINKTESIKEINFQDIIKNQKKHYLTSPLSPDYVKIIFYKNGKDKIKVEKK